MSAKKMSPTKKKSFATGSRKTPADKTSDPVIRALWMLVELFLHKQVSFEACMTRYGCSLRTFQRDLASVRAIGEQSGLSISTRSDGSYELASDNVKVRSLHRRATETDRLIGIAVRAMGKAVAAETGHLSQEPDPEEEIFYHFAVPTLNESGGSSILATNAVLKKAWMNKALVRFDYPDAQAVSGSRERLVEPHRVLHRSGVDYLLAYDRRKNAWRTFALDRFLSTPVAAGTNHNDRTIPPEYASDDVLGFMKSDQPKTKVTVELSRFVAASAVSRRWQAAQRVEPLDGGRARIVFTVGEPSEVVRWAFGFGKDAKIIAPPETVHLARDMARAIATQHEIETAE